MRAAGRPYHGIASVYGPAGGTATLWADGSLSCVRVCLAAFWPAACTRLRALPCHAHAHLLHCVLFRDVVIFSVRFRRFADSVSIIPYLWMGPVGGHGRRCAGSPKSDRRDGQRSGKLDGSLWGRALSFFTTTYHGQACV